MAVVAEGVETSAQHDELVALGCDMSQGHHYARPMSADLVDDLLRGRGEVSVPLVSTSLPDR